MLTSLKQADKCYYTTLLATKSTTNYCRSVQNTLHPSDIWMDYNVRVQITVLISLVWNLVRQVKGGL